MRRRNVDIPSSLFKYTERLKTMGANLFNDLSGSLLGTFEIYSTHFDIPEGDRMDCFAAALMREARKRGVNIIGVTSERKRLGEYICYDFGEGRNRSNTHVVYVGKFSYFSGHERSVWAPTREDFVFIQPPPPEEEFQ